MKLIRPVEITEALLVYSSEAESEHALWAAGTSFTIGMRTIRNHVIYESVHASAQSGRDPALQVNSAYWARVGPTNRWAAFDKVVGTRTRSTATPSPGAPYQLVMTVKPGLCDAVAVLDVHAHRAKLEILVGGIVVHSVTENTGDVAPIADWYDYFHEPIVPATAVVFQDLPAYPTGEYRLTLQHDSEPTHVGTVVYGRMYTLGLTQYGASFGINDYSRKEVDTTFGELVSVEERGFSKRVNVRVEVDNKQVDQVDRILSSIRATPVVWICAGNLFRSLIVYGFYKDWTVDIPYFSHSFCSIQIEGLLQQ